MSQVLRRRDLVALVLIKQKIDLEYARVKSRKTTPALRGALMAKPTVGWLWKKSDDGEPVSVLNDFFAEHGGFEEPFKWLAQTTNIVKNLRDLGLIYDPQVEEDAAIIGDIYALVPTEQGEALYWELFELCGEDPLKWPDRLPYRGNMPKWDEAVYSPQPAY